MNASYTRRHFIKTSAAHAVGIGMANTITGMAGTLTTQGSNLDHGDRVPRANAFIPRCAASWWCELEDLLWPQKKIIDKIKHRAEAFAKASIDTAINFGFHIRFDFANYFAQLHGYYADVCEELHKYDIKFVDHYSCNHVQRPRGETEFAKLHKNHRHHILLFHDPIAAEHAQYAGHYFRDICQVSLRDGSRGYAKQYQLEAFCYNNPGFIEMHKKYLQRLMNEVSLDAIEVDDMCNYAGLLVCGCVYCRDRFKRDYGQVLPDLTDDAFWGDTKNKNEFSWGNYENPAFRDWLRMRADVIADHLQMVKSTVGPIPLMTCCSSSGPMSLNAVALNLERMSSSLDWFMLENCGININSVDWLRMDAEALLQKDIAHKKNNAPALALSYTIYEKGGYLGWSLSRFWGVANWSSTLNQRLEQDPKDMQQIEDIVYPLHSWENKHSDWHYQDGIDCVEVRLVNSRACRENGWLAQDGLEQWEKSKAWSTLLAKANIGYRFVRDKELANPVALRKEKTPLILDSIGCISDEQFHAIQSYLAKGGTVWLALPFGTHDEKGFPRSNPLAQTLMSWNYPNLILIDTATAGDPLAKLIQADKFRPVLTQRSGDTRWAARIRFYQNQPVIHFLSTGLVAVPHPEIVDGSGMPILKEIDTLNQDNHLSYRINLKKVPISSLSLMSPELGEQVRKVDLQQHNNGTATLGIDLTGVKIYAVAHTKS